MCFCAEGRRIGALGIGFHRVSKPPGNFNEGPTCLAGTWVRTSSENGLPKRGVLHRKHGGFLESKIMCGACSELEFETKLHKTVSSSRGLYTIIAIEIPDPNSTNDSET